MTPKEKASEIVMLTPTQEAMQWVWEQRESTNSYDAILALDAVYQHLQKVTLEKEKEVMESAWQDGMYECDGDGTFEDFYKTFNTKEK
jgi:hypothetical protein